ncbi:glycosyltransferase [Alkalinema sp. FACHB-956]|uniref:glycosyltransferase n=1 Tax=Alkalinema sp. FACHB-956 TaxID=2692768 RepID=UPI001688626B|nr:glycosyl transferase [Alkalinema sp. FACHB-956]
MKRLMFYCQHILGMGHLVRSMEIVRGLTQEFQVCFINGGEIINGFDIPAGVEVVNLPAIKTDAEFRALQVVDSDLDLAAVEAIRRAQLLQVYHQFQPDVLMIELFPFGRRKFSFELIPLLDAIQADDRKTKVVCSLRDIVVTKQNREKHEQKVCTLINQYFDLLLIHGDPKFQPIEETFSRIKDLQCPVYYTGYVVQPQPVESATLPIQEPIILATIGGGRFGHELLDAVVAAAPALETLIPHQIQVFTGPFYPEEKLQDLQWKATNCGNLRVDRYTPNLLQYMQRADLSISMSGYNTTLNVLTTGVKAMLMAFTGNDDQEQRMRSQKLAAMDLVTTIQPEDLAVDRFVALIQSCLQKPQQTVQFDFDGVAKTASLVRSMFEMQQVA